jgi:osmoprotectant transport system permease protein
VVLDDPKRAIPPYDAILLVAPKRAGDEALAGALAPLVNAIDVVKMRAANLRATITSPEEVARWLAGEIKR